MKIQYQVSMPQPTNHLFQVDLTLEDGFPHQSPWVFSLPVWTPGSYLIREYSRHIQGVQAWYGDVPIAVQKVSKNRWQTIVSEPLTSDPLTSEPATSAPLTSDPIVSVSNNQPLRLSYQVLAAELTVRTNHLDATHGYFNPAALLLAVEGYSHLPHQVTIVLPQAHWQVATPLPSLPDAPLTFEASDYDQLVDSPFEMGEHERFEFTVLDKPHSLVIWGKGNYDAQWLMGDISRIIETEAALWGGLPYNRYLFLIHLGTSYAGLEHRDSCSLICPRQAFRQIESYQTVLNLIAHEFFHLWNVKRLRPKALETFDYDRENYTPSLWFSEGVTSYYDLLIPQRSGLYESHTFLSLLGKEISRFLNTPGRWVQPLRESSWDAWIKLYRRDAHSDNHHISYYLKGAMVTLLLDLRIRERHQNRRSFDDVLRSLWQEWGQPERGFTEADVAQAIAQVLGSKDFLADYQDYLDGTAELPFAEAFAPFGLELVPLQSSLPFWGLSLYTERGRVLIQSVLANSPGQTAGVEPEDELIAIDGLRVTSSEQALNLLQNYLAGESIALTVFHQDLLQTRSVILENPQPSQYELRLMSHPSPAQKALYEGWLGT